MFTYSVKVSAERSAADVVAYHEGIAQAIPKEPGYRGVAAD